MALAYPVPGFLSASTALASDATRGISPECRAFLQAKNNAPWGFHLDSPARNRLPVLALVEMARGWLERWKGFFFFLVHPETHPYPASLPHLLPSFEPHYADGDGCE